MKRTFLITLTLTLMLLCFSAFNAEALSNEIYLQQGAVDGDGTESKPYGDLEDAINALDGQDGKIFVIGTYDMTDFEINAWGGMVTVIGADSNAEIKIDENCGAILNGDITFQNINFDIGNYAHFSKMGGKLILDSGADTVYDSIIHLTNFGRSIVDYAHTEFRSGQFDTVHAAGAYCQTYAFGCLGDSTIVIDGAQINRLRISADKFATNHTGISVGGNLNVIYNSGNINKLNYEAQTVPEIMGALNIIFNNGKQPPVGEFKYPESAAGGVYIIKSAPGGKVMPTSDIGEFTLTAAPGKIAVINGQKIADGTVSLQPGETIVNWTDYNAPAEDPLNIKITVGSNEIVVNGRTNTMDVPAQLVNGEVMIQVRPLSEAMLLSVEWDDATRTITIIKDNNTLKMTLFDPFIYLNGEPTSIPVPATIIDGRTMIPAKAISTVLGYNTQWDSDSGKLTILNSALSETQTTEYYVQQGNRGNGTQGYPMGTIEEAISALDGREGTIYIVGTYNISNLTAATSWENMITVTGASEESLLTVNDNVGAIIGGPLTIKDIDVDLGKYSHLNTTEHPLIIDAGDDVDFETASYSMINFPMIGNGTVEEGYLELKSGMIPRIFLGAYITEEAKCTGDATIEINGGMVDIISLSANKFSNSHKAITFGGNLNIIQNAGKISSINAGYYDAAIKVKGAVNFIFNNGLIPPASFAYPEDVEKGVYIIRSSPGGKVLPSEQAGVFTLVAEPGKVAFINGEAINSDTITLTPGETIITWASENFVENAPGTFYVQQGSNGDGTESYPFGTIEEAITRFYGHGGTIYIIGKYDISHFSFDEGWDGMVTVKGADARATIYAKQSIGVNFKGDITFKDINFNIETYANFNPFGTKFIMDGGQNSEFSSILHLSTYGSIIVEEAYAKLKSGVINTVHAAGGYCTSYANGVMGDSDIIIDGATVNSLLISADRYMDSQTGISIGGNLNIICNAGRLNKINYIEDTQPEIMGALNFIFNNGMQAPETFNYPEECAEGGVYIINSAAGGIVTPAKNEVGIFRLSADSGKTAIVNGEPVDSETVTLEPGEHTVEWVDADETVDAAGVFLDKTEAHVAWGRTATLYATVTPWNATNKNVTWETSDASVATVENGIVTGISEGVAVITVKTSDGEHTAQCTVNVFDPSPKFSATSAACKSGESVDIVVSLKNNPGFALFGFDVDYDRDALTLTGVTAGNIFTADEFSESNIESVPYKGLAYTGDENKTSDGEFITLTFAVKAETESGSYNVSIVPTEVYDINEKDVFIPSAMGIVEVCNSIPGDVTGDEMLNTQDLLLLAKHFAGWNVEIDNEASDVTSDGLVDLQDLLRLAKYFAGWDVTLG